MSAKLSRFAIPAMFLGLGAAIVYALSSAASGGKAGDPLEKFAAGAMAGLDFAFAGDAPDLRDGAPVRFIGPDGGPVTLDDFKGRTVLVNLWATWCAPCEREMPSLAALQTARGGEAFAVLTISVDDAEAGDYARGKLEDWTGGVLDFYHAPDYAITYALGARGFPTSVLLGPDGLEIARLSGEADWASYEAVGFVDAVLEASGG